MINGVPRILIVRLSAIGDVVRVLPALHALRSRFPSAQIDWAVEDKSRAVVEGHPDLDRCLVFSRAAHDGGIRTFFAFLRSIRAARYDVIVDFHGILKSGLISAFSGAPDRYGFAPPRGRELSYLFARHRLSLPRRVMNRIEENLALSEAMGASPELHDSPIAVPEEAQADVEAFFNASFDGGKRIIAVHPAVERATKQWPISAFAELVDALLADGRFEVMLTWGPGQRAIAQAVADRAKRKPIIAPETPDLKHYAWLIHCCDLYFGGDTGPMHVAAAMGTPVVAVFGGTDPARHAPLRNPGRVLYAGPANPPRRIRPAQAAEYMSRITPEMAYDACVQVCMRSGRGGAATQNV